MSATRVLHPAIATVGVLSRKEAWRVLSSPATPILLTYLLLVAGVDVVVGGDQSEGMFRREAIAELLAYVGLLLYGPITFVGAHLVTSSAGRSGSERMLAATPLGERRRDLALCLGVLVGPVLVSLVVAATSAWLASGLPMVPDSDGQVPDYWSWIDVAQVPAIVLGGGILGVVVARWLRFPGSLLLGFVAMVIGTGWLLTGEGAAAIRPWFAPYVIIPWWSESSWATAGGSQVWHLAYLLGLSGLGVCAVALRHPWRRARWLVAATVALGMVVVAGVLQLPAAA
jgi:hypothetical protein